MESKNQIRVIIAGKSVCLGGFESEKYLQEVAEYISKKSKEIEKTASYRFLTPELRSALLSINVADDLFKAKMRVDTLENELAEKYNQLEELNNELVELRIEMHNKKRSTPVSADNFD